MQARRNRLGEDKEDSGVVPPSKLCNPAIALP
jgi:hypothetical protein